MPTNASYHSRKPAFHNTLLNDAQKRAVFSEEGPILIAAGAGSGKTKTLTSRLIYFLQNGARGEQIIAITFTNKAAREMAERVMTIMGKEERTEGLFIGTFHSLGYWILKAEAEFLGRKPNFSVFDEDDAFSIIKNIMKNSEDGVTAPEARAKIAYFKNTLVSKDGTETDETDKKFQLIFEKYERRLKENNAFDFDDLIQKAVTLWKNQPQVLLKYQNKWKHILVDECQDINRAQYEFIKCLAEKHRSLFVIGDDAQAIYSFRQADFKHFLNFESDWPGAKTFLLEENYRSSGNIVKAAGAVIQNNLWQKRKNLWTKNPDGTLIKIAGLGSPEEEGEWIAQQIENLKILFRRPEAAVLYRTNAQSRAIEQALIQANAPYEIYGGMKFYDRKEIKDIMAGLRFGLNPDDSLARDRIEKNFNKTKAEKILQNAPALAKEKTALELIGFFLKETDYLTYLARNYENSEERIENIQELIRVAANYENQKAPAGLQAFLEQAALIQQTDAPANKEAASIKLMTIHLAKGLEFEAVFVAGCDEGLMPHHKSYYASEAIEEERRLMYVAMTRAKKELFLSFHNTASRFLYEIPPELTEVASKEPLPNEEDRYISLD